MIFALSGVGWREVARGVSDYLVRVVDPFGKKVLVDINLID
jgi:hypothetical protein